MTLSLDPARTAMLVIEMQNDLVHPSLAERRGLPGALARAVAERGILPRLAGLLAACRTAGMPVVYATKERHPSIPSRGVAPIERHGSGILAAGSWGAQVVDDLKPQPEDLLVPRYVSIDPSHGSTLWADLGNLGAETIVCAGVSTTLAVEGTVRGAVNRGVRAVVVEDCCASVPHEWHEFSVRNVIPLLADVVSAAEVEAVLG